MTMSIPSIWSSGHMRPASPTTRCVAVSTVIMLRPISPRPPRKVRSTQLSVAASGPIREIRVIDRGQALVNRVHQLFLAAEILGENGGANDHPHRAGPDPDGAPGLNEAGAAQGHRHHWLPGPHGHDEDPLLEGPKLGSSGPG